MSITVKELIEKLAEKDQSAEVEFIICKTNGEVVCMDVEKQAKPLIKLLKMFG